jgi:pimeloyl-ACP methyl ester carboxylesterase
MGLVGVPVDGAVLACHRSQGPTDKTLVFFHGNGEIVDDYLPWFPQLWGVGTVLVEYRGYGASTGRPSLITMLDDAEQVVNELGLDPEKIIVFGRSVGSIYAVHLASRFPQIAGLILESAIADPLERILLRVHAHELGTTISVLENEANIHLNHQAKMNAYGGPLLLLHTEHDGLVDISHAERLFEWAGGRDKKLVRYPHGDHNSIFFTNQDDYIRTVRNFMRPGEQ